MDNYQRYTNLIDDFYTIYRETQNVGQVFLIQLMSGHQIKNIYMAEIRRNVNLFEDITDIKQKYLKCKEYVDDRIEKLRKSNDPDEIKKGNDLLYAKLKDMENISIRLEDEKIVKKIKDLEIKKKRLIELSKTQNFLAYYFSGTSQQLNEVENELHSLYNKIDTF